MEKARKSETPPTNCCATRSQNSVKLYPVIFNICTPSIIFNICTPSNIFKICTQSNIFKICTLHTEQTGLNRNSATYCWQAIVLCHFTKVCTLTCMHHVLKHCQHKDWEGGKGLGIKSVISWEGGKVEICHGKNCQL